MAGVLIGLKDLYVGILDEVGKTYGAPERIAKAIEAKVTPNVSSTVLYADDSAAESASSEGETEIELNIDALSNGMYAKLLGKKTNEDGVVYDSSDDQAPTVAFGFRSLKSNGKHRYVWFTKGKFQLPEENYKTKGDTVEYNTPSIKAVFVHNDEGVKRYIVDEDDEGVAPTVIANWFKSVYSPTPIV